MGLFSFVKSAGRSIGLFGGQQAAEAEKAVEAAVEKAKAAGDEAKRVALHDTAVALDIKTAIEGHGIPIADLAVGFSVETAILTGTATAQADAEKAVLIAGNTEGVGTVQDDIVVEVPEPPAVHHTVVKGDTLSKISLAQYGSMRLYDAIFEANRPMLADPDEIYPGQVLRIPRFSGLTHTVASGETLGSIAKHHYGKPARYTEIFEANRGVLDDPNVVEVGQQLVIPMSGPAVHPDAPQA